MKLSIKSEYACLALIHLAERFNSGMIKSEEIAAAKGIPKKFLDQILFTLKNAGYVRSKRGPHGGYRLSRQPSRITVAEILRLLDGPLAPVHSASTYYYESTPIERNKKMLEVLVDIRNFAAQRLENTTFNDLI